MTARPMLAEPVAQPYVNAPSLSDDERRAAVIRDHGASETSVVELLAYGASAFDAAALLEPPPLPLADEPSTVAWDEYARDAQADGVLQSLRRRLVQLHFPVESGMSQRTEYQAATRRGRLDGADALGLQLDEPDRLELFLHSTAAGRIPVIVVSRRADFVRLIQALTRRNEPDVIPDTMGACIVGGYNNWDRVRRLRAEWLASSPLDASEAAWSVVFRDLAANSRARYQDRFILLSSGPYSATPASAVGIASETEWLRLSGTIRLEHECTHYFTRRIFGSMRNTVLDELCADYAGIVAACGRFRPEWFLRFVGLEHPDTYRVGGRLENYRGTPELSDDAFAALQRLVRSATAQLARLDDARRAEGHLSVANVVIGIARMGLELLASDDGWLLLDAEIRQFDSHIAAS